MQIDFHHATTYVVAREAGFDHPQANTIACAAQYVDDATHSGSVCFDNGALYQRINSAHKMLDPRNTQELANHHVWMAFHFLPGNAGLVAGRNPKGKFIEKIICKPDSPVAREVVRDAILDNARPYSLHRLGVTMHVYADTWAHQGFAGVLHPEVNEVEDAKEVGKATHFHDLLANVLRDTLDDAIPPLGHGRALDFPDLPYLKWEYRNGQDVTIKRNNTRDFLQAADKMCIAMRRYLAGNPDADVQGLSAETRAQIENMFLTTTDRKADKRHEKWMEAIRQGKFTVCGKVNIDDYFPSGNDSWKARALGTSYDLPVHKYSDYFLESDWKRFHDALHAHRFNVVYNILPKYGICAA